MQGRIESSARRIGTQAVVWKTDVTIVICMLYYTYACLHDRGGHNNAGSPQALGDTNPIRRRGCSGGARWLTSLTYVRSLTCGPDSALHSCVYLGLRSLPMRPMLLHALLDRDSAVVAVLQAWSQKRRPFSRDSTVFFSVALWRSRCLQ